MSKGKMYMIFFCGFFFCFSDKFLFWKTSNLTEKLQNLHNPYILLWNSPIVNIISRCRLPLHINILTHNFIIIAEPFERMLQISWSFPPKYFSIYLLKTGKFSYIICTGVNSVSPQIHLHLNFRKWPYLEIRSLQMQLVKLRWGHMGLEWGLNPMTSVLIRPCEDTDTHEKALWWPCAVTELQAKQWQGLSAPARSW